MSRGRFQARSNVWDIPRTLFIPAYRRVWNGPENLVDRAQAPNPDRAKVVEGTVLESRFPESNVRVFLIDQPDYFDREGLYGDAGTDFGDNSERFIFFDRAVLETIRIFSLDPDVIHCNDWQTGLIPVYLQTMFRPLTGLHRRAPCTRSITWRTRASSNTT